MKRKFTIAVMLVLMIISSACANVSYLFATASRDGEQYYIDEGTVTEVTRGDIIRFWVKRVVPQKARNTYVANAKSKKEKNLYSRIVEFKEYYEISLKNNTARTIALYAYNSKGQAIDTFTDNNARWFYIVPGSIDEALCDGIKTILSARQEKSSRPPFMTVPEPKNLTASQRYTWDRLQEYFSWLVLQPDFGGFCLWYLKQVEEAGVTPEKVDEGLYNLAMQNGGNFMIVRSLIDSWYKDYQSNPY